MLSIVRCPASSALSIADQAISAARELEQGAPVATAVEEALEGAPVRVQLRAQLLSDAMAKVAEGEAMPPELARRMASWLLQ